MRSGLLWRSGCRVNRARHSALTPRVPSHAGSRLGTSTSATTSGGARPPNCVSRADLWKAVSELMSEHLDRARPLWTFDVIGPLADGREAIAVRIHHAM